MLFLVQVILTLWVSWARGQVKPCDFPEMKHGRLYREEAHRLSFPVSVGTWYYYYCDENYVTASEGAWDYITCKRDGWTPKLPCRQTCLKSKVTIENGFIADSEPLYLLNQKVKYECRQDYVTEDGHTSGYITCLQNGWSAQPRCIKSCGMPVFENARAKSNGTWFKVNDKLAYECQNGYKNGDGQTMGSIVCGENGWSDTPTCHDSTGKCGPPPVIDNGDITTYPSAVYAPGSSVEYQCQAYYELEGNRRITCRDGAWSEPPKCLVKPCDFPEIKHGRLYREEAHRLSFPVSVGQWFYYSCDENYVTASEGAWDYITCKKDGWTPKLPCRKTCLKSKVTIENGFIADSASTYPLNKIAKYKCKQGYVTEDGHTSGYITCLQNGWSAQPRCIKSCDMPIFEDARAKSYGTWFKLNDTLDYQCLDGYENKDGNALGSMVCGEDGWSHLPTCFKSADKCGPPPAISNGDITSLPLEVYPPGSRVEYQCQAYFELQGPKYVTCSYAKWSEPPRCIDPCVISEKIMNEKNIQLKGKDDKPYYVKTGDIVEFMCKSGHKAVTSEESFQAVCREGTVEFPRCE
ncbi:complement factor H-related protein 4-like isoform X1 [Eptesicus fuscus]|uniref:complement factor H-related protein 4-like isoform X1 n=1 Tax=Eptesicus fuscus TaxID=29078 RepID=UPI0024040599|nr:complement factor H-related protein 4-like isoform X1 [Eptesicus fuscus]